MLMQVTEWDVHFRMEFGHHPIAPVDLTLTCSEPDLEAVVRSLRRSGAHEITMTQMRLPQIPEPPARTIPLQQFDGPAQSSVRLPNVDDL